MDATADGGGIGESTDLGGNTGTDSGAIGSATRGGAGTIRDADGFTIIEPKSVGRGGSGTDGDGPRRGRKPGRPVGGKSSQKTPFNLDGIESLLVSVHAMLAIKVPEMALDKDEAKRLAIAIAEVKKHYPDTILTDKQLAWIALATVAGTTYGPRLYLLRERKKSEKAAATPNPKVANLFGMQ